jgi:hypothetical protein
MSDTATAVKDDAAAAATAPAAADVSTPVNEDLDRFDLDPNDFKDTGDQKPKEEGADKGESDDAEADASDDAAATDKPAEGAEDAADASQTNEDKPKGADARKEQLNSEIRDLVTKRNELKKQVEEANAKVYQPQTEEALKEGGMSELEAKVEAMRQQQEIDKYNSTVAEAQLVIESESERVIRDFPVFNPEMDGKGYNKQLHEAASELFNANLIKDENTGQTVGTHMPIYKLYKLINDAVQIGTASGEAKGAKAVKKAIASADVVASSGPKGSKTKDKFESAFDKEFDKY